MAACAVRLAPCATLLVRLSNLSDEEEEGAGVQAKGKPVSYRVTVWTGKQAEAGTDAPVKLSLYGPKGGTGPHTLEDDDPSTNDEFGDGSVDTFEVTAPDVGPIRHIRIGHDSADGWFLRKVLVEAPEPEPAASAPISFVVTTITGQSFEITKLTPSDSIASLKAQISDQAPELSPGQQRIILDGAELPDRSSLSECGVVDGSALNLAMKLGASSSHADTASSKGSCFPCYRWLDVDKDDLCPYRTLVPRRPDDFEVRPETTCSPCAC